MKQCSTCKQKIHGDYAECFGGDLICETCLWKEAEETVSLREYISWLIDQHEDYVIDWQGWFDLIASHQQLIDLGLEHKLPDARAV